MIYCKASRPQALIGWMAVLQQGTVILCSTRKKEFEVKGYVF